MGARVDKDAYRQGLRDSLKGVDERNSPYAGNTVAAGVAHHSWIRGVEHGLILMNAARKFADDTQCALGANQQRVVDLAFIEKIGECFEITI